MSVKTRNISILILIAILISGGFILFYLKGSNSTEESRKETVEISSLNDDGYFVDKNIRISRDAVISNKLYIENGNLEILDGAHMVNEIKVVRGGMKSGDNVFFDKVAEIDHDVSIGNGNEFKEALIVAMNGELQVGNENKFKEILVVNKDATLGDRNQIDGNLSASKGKITLGNDNYINGNLIYERLEKGNNNIVKGDEIKIP